MSTTLTKAAARTRAKTSPRSLPRPSSRPGMYVCTRSHTYDTHYRGRFLAARAFGGCSVHRCTGHHVRACPESAPPTARPASPSFPTTLRPSPGKTKTERVKLNLKLKIDKRPLSKDHSGGGGRFATQLDHRLFLRHGCPHRHRSRCGKSQGVPARGPHTRLPS